VYNIIQHLNTASCLTLQHLRIGPKLIMASVAGQHAVLPEGKGHCSMQKPSTLILGIDRGMH